MNGNTQEHHSVLHVNRNLHKVLRSPRSARISWGSREADRQAFPKKRKRLGGAFQAECRRVQVSRGWHGGGEGTLSAWLGRTWGQDCKPLFRSQVLHSCGGEQKKRKGSSHRIHDPNAVETKVFLGWMGGDRLSRLGIKITLCVFLWMWLVFSH